MKRFLVVLALLATGCVKTANTELDAYIAQVRARGMTDEAYQALLTVAAVRSGATILDFSKDAERGVYRRTYTSSYCARPNADPKEIEKLKQQAAQRAEAELARLKPLADRDHSGFITTEEAMKLRSAFEFGLEANAIAKAEGIHDLDALARLLGAPKDFVVKQMGEYTQLLARAREIQVDLPPLLLRAAA